jgi:ubiquinone/menaquinone biosynthesis C-methylase UbiE
MFRRLYDRFFARFYDAGMARTERAGLRDRRSAIVGQATGDVVEIGAGTGANVDLYDEAVRVTFVEPSAPMATRLRDRLQELGRSDAVVEAGAESIPLPDAQFDTAVSTLVLCTVDDVDRALAEIRRLLRPGGRLLFVEHVRADEPGSARWQDRLAPMWRVVGNGCNCNRDTASAIERAGFAIDSIEHGETPLAPPIVRPMIWGVATRGE